MKSNILHKRMTAHLYRGANTRGGYSVRFWIGMLSTARRLETLQGSKKEGRNYTFCPILMKNRGRNTTFSSFLLKYRGRNYTNFPETWKRGSKWRSICSNLHIVSAPPGSQQSGGFAAYGVYGKHLDTVGPLYFDWNQFNGIVLVQRYLIIIAGSVHFWYKNWN